MTSLDQASRPEGELRWLARQLWPHRRLAMGSIALLGATILLSSADPLLIKWMIDDGMRSQTRHVVVVALVLLGAVYASRLWLGYVSGLVGFTLSARLVTSLRVRLYRRLQTRDLQYIEQQPAGDLARTIEDDVDQATRAAVDLVPALLRVVLTAATTVIILLSLNWRLTLCAVPIVPFLLLVRLRFRGALGTLADGARQALGQRSSTLLTGLVNHPQVVAIGAERYFRGQFVHSAVRATRAGLRQRRSELVYGIGSAALIGVATIAVLWAGTMEVASQRLSIGGYIAFYSYLSRLFEPALASTELYASLKRAGAPIRRLITLGKQEDTRVGRGGSICLTPNEWHSIEFDGVRAGYRDECPVLTGASFALRAGDFVAMTGKSGSGKSLIAQILLRLRPIGGGIYRIGEHDVNDLQLESTREAIAYVPARPFLIPASLRENVCLGAQHVSDDRLNRAAKTACFDTVVTQYAAGWDHVLTPDGSGLSDGERQRLGMARALLQERPLLIVDEGTGAVDESVERTLLERLRKARADRITLYITHRRSAAAMADYVLSLQDGRVYRSDSAHLRQATSATIPLSQPGVDSSRPPCPAAANVGITFSQG